MNEYLTSLLGKVLEIPGTGGGGSSDCALGSSRMLWSQWEWQGAEHMGL